MALTKERKQQIIIAVLAISVLLIMGALYLYIRQNKNLERANLNIAGLVDSANVTNVEATEKVTEAEENTEGPTKACLQCLCKVVSGCKPVKCANQPPCGIYAISKWFWADVGKLKTTENSTEYSDQDEEFRDYLRCVNDEKCATATVRNYLQIYSRDCDGDGKIDCADYIALHLYGPTGCKTEPIKALRKQRMRNCVLD